MGDPQPMLGSPPHSDAGAGHGTARLRHDQVRKVIRACTRRLACATSGPGRRKPDAPPPSPLWAASRGTFLDAVLFRPRIEQIADSRASHGADLTSVVCAPKRD